MPGGAVRVRRVPGDAVRARGASSTSTGRACPAWLAALLGGALAFAAMGVAIGGLAREVRAASLLAFALSLPIAFLALVPTGAVDDRLYTVIDGVSVAVPVQAGAARARRGDRRRRARRPAAAPARRSRSRFPPLARPRAAPLRLSLGCARLGRMAFPATRMRRLRRTAPLRDLVRETELAASHLVYPMFVVAGGEKRAPIASMPGIDHLSIDGAVEEAGIAHVARHPGRAAVRPPGRQGRAGHGRLGRRGRRPARHARDQGRAPRPARDRRPVPVRVHEPRPLRRAARRRGRRQRRRRSSCSPAPPSPRPRPAPTPSRRAT